MSNDVFAVVADPTRRRILTVVKDGPRPVNDVVTELGVSQPTVSKHLKVLREAGLVTMKAQGQRRLYSLNPVPLESVREWADQLVSETPDAEATELAGTEAETAETGDPETGAPEVAASQPPEVEAPDVVRTDDVPASPSGAEPASAPSTVQEPGPAHRRVRQGVVFAPLAPLSAREPTEADEIKELTSDLAPAVVPGEQASDEASAREDVAHLPQSEEQTRSTEWEPLDSEVRRTREYAGAQHVAGETKQSGFLANLFSRKRGR
ncbi:MAG: metalloregulator ArsR/SmtB family transcription factor [Kocuria sp.]|nr:metalloregulator ArsR/SmtB family transcription factor [Kocuria sp.]MDN5617830.1 metalloregulator ArsR/SmtB family transcription factor [Kocuria sp.]MDN5655662.1 metalloregulator ArsR/SmtB family transcription factor [Kocuria sp.]